MIKKIVVHRKMTRAELGAIVCDALIDSLNDSPVLVGGAAAYIYSKGRYRSDDLDIISYREKRLVAPVMKKLGFKERGSYWTHPETDLLVQFVSGPPMIGKKYVKQSVQVKTATGTLRIISALDSACDRLIWYLQGDARSLEQCASIIIAQKIPIANVRDWLAEEEWSDTEKEKAIVALQKEVRRLRHGK